VNNASVTNPVVQQASLAATLSSTSTPSSSSTNQSQMTQVQSSHQHQQQQQQQTQMAQPVNVTEYYSPETDQWTIVKQSINLHKEATCFKLSNYIYVIGGYNIQAKTGQKCISRYDFLNDHWQTIAQLPNGMTGLGSCLIDLPWYEFQPIASQNEGLIACNQRTDSIRSIAQQQQRTLKDYNDDEDEEEEEEDEQTFESIRNGNIKSFSLYDAKFPVPKNILINNKLMSKSGKSSSYYRQNDDRLESENEADFVTHSFLYTSFNNSKADAVADLNRIKPKANIRDPRFDMRPSDRLVRLGETVKFTCKVSGSKPLEVFWFKMNGDELLNNEKYEIYHDDEFHYLKIFNTVQRDAGMYLCVISNELEQNIDSFQLQLRGKPSLLFLFSFGFV
jgi:hypothetical protein